jgi:prepilin-type N-terminal cleavage/methylation domain-containing protein
VSERFSATQRAFSLLELLISVAVIAVLIGLLLPALIYARSISHTTLCAADLKQIGGAWEAYLQENHRFPQTPAAPDWNYGGVRFVGLDHHPVLDESRPLNRFVHENDSKAANSTPESDGHFALLFRCPADSGVFKRGLPTRAPRVSILDGGKTCFEFFGTSYRANPALLDSTKAGLEGPRRPLSEQEVYVDQSRLLLAGDAAWYYATRPDDDPDHQFDASWHGKPGGGNMLAADGSVRFMVFGPGATNDWFLYPRPTPPPGN